MTKTKNDVYEPIDLCSCFDMVFDPPASVIRAWEKDWEERFMVNKERVYYGTELDGTLYYYNGNTRTKVTEFFNPNGKTMDKLIENVVRFAAGGSVSTENSINC